MKREVVYIAELDADIDDIIAAEYLHRQGVLKMVVCDPLPKTVQGKQRKQELEKLGITVAKKMPPAADYVFIGGALTEVARYLINHQIKYLVMNGGFVGCNIVKEPLKKFEGKETMRTFNFNCDVNAADQVLKSKNIENIILIGKNVCHSRQNTLNGVWSAEKELLEKYKVRPDKRQHDMLACHEGLILTGLVPELKPYLSYQKVYPYNTGLRGNMTKWGSRLKETQYREVTAAVRWEKQVKR